MKLDDLQTLVARLDAVNVMEMEYSDATSTLILRFHHRQLAGHGRLASIAADPGVRLPAPLRETALAVVPSPGVGRLIAAHPLQATPSGSSGRVCAGQPIGFLAVDEVYSAIVAPVDGIMGRQVTGDDVIVGFGQPLFELAPAGEVT